tara:strand:+ start:201 stop:386 length:186 start_codon:yes stop_codon:yes gene_type:complete
MYRWRHAGAKALQMLNVQTKPTNAGPFDHHHFDNRLELGRIGLCCVMDLKYAAKSRDYSTL